MSYIAHSLFSKFVENFSGVTLSIIFLTLHWLIESIRPFLVPICFISAWGFIILGLWNLIMLLQHGLSKAHEMHQIPCTDCQFFTDSAYLKCTVRPDIALSEKAIDCADYVEAIYGAFIPPHSPFSR